ncbi:MAG: hypothetical protein KAR38_17480 [Calditrichia bacterium]|nr:hypothetical protein [Calditrichia bacterium]
MEQLKDFKKIWLIILSIVSALFLVNGFVMIIIDKNYYNGGQYLITAIVYSIAVLFIGKDKIKINYSNPMFNLGFVFSIIGLKSPAGSGLYIGMWIFGIAFFISGLFYNKTVKKEDKNATI